MSEPAPADGRSPASPQRSWWRENGCFIWALGPFVVAIPVWLLVFPESYDRALDFVIDALITVLWLAITAILLGAVIRGRKTVSPLAYLLAALSVAVAALMAWNLTASYAGVGNQPVSLFGWGWTVRPGNLSLLVVGVMLCLGLAAAGIQRLRGRPSQ